tara:strand:+ start:2773 stop:4089 length:1317 start_codon:yes stop_codon:yes gene_type:complete
MQNNPSNFTYLSSGSWLLFEQVSRAIISSIYIFILAFYLGPSDFGIFIFVLTILGIIKVLINFGVEDILVKLFGTDYGNYKQYLSAALYIKILINLIILIICVFIYTVGMNFNFILLALIILLFFNFFSTFEVIGFYYESQVQGKKIAICKLSQLLVVTLIKAYFLLNESDLIFFIVAFGLEFFFLGIFYCISLRKELLEILFSSFNKRVFKKIVLESYGYLFIGILGVLFVRVDQLMVKYFLDFEQLGYFGLSVRFTDVLFLLPIIFAKTIFPVMIKKSKDKMAYETFLGKIFISAVWISTILNLIILIFGYFLISKFFPDSNYVQSYYVLTIYIWALIPYTFNQITYRWLMIKNKVKDNFVRLVFALIINVLLNYSLIPLMGIFGAAIATLLSFTLLSLLPDIIYPYSRKLFFTKIKSFNPINIFVLFKWIKNGTN